MTAGEQLIYKLKREAWEQREEGREEGRKDGRKDGRNEEKRETASNLIKMGMQTDFIAKATGLSDSEIEEVRKANT